MPATELNTEQIIQKVKSLTNKVKEIERSESELIGKRDGLYERLEKELGFKTVKEAREEAKKKEAKMARNDKIIREKFEELEERPEWALLIHSS